MMRTKIRVTRKSGKMDFFLLSREKRGNQIGYGIERNLPRRRKINVSRRMKRKGGKREKGFP